MTEKSIFETMENDIYKSDMSEEQKQIVFKNIIRLKNSKINLMITGATGCGKSSTINALFNTEVAKVGVGVDPETMDIKKYELDNLILWDSPGLGDGKEADIRHSKNIIQKLCECDNTGKALIDLVLVILDGSTKDLGTSAELINSVIIPNLGQNKKDRILVAINQADMAKKGRCWDYKNNKPELELVQFLEEKVESTRRRIYNDTGVDITPIYYSAGFKDGNEKQNPYNLSKLLYFIIQHTPEEKRLTYVDNISTKDEMWKDSDELIDYSREIKKSFAQTVVDCAAAGAERGGNFGAIFGKTAEKIGRVAGGLIGGAIGFVKGLFG